MKNKYQLEKRIRSMKLGDSFDVKTEEERQAALRAGTSFFRGGFIEFKISTCKLETNDGFRIKAIPA